MKTPAKRYNFCQSSCRFLIHESSMIHSTSPQSWTAMIFHVILKSCDGRTTCVNIVITTGQDCGRPRGSKGQQNDTIFLVHPVNFSPRSDHTHCGVKERWFRSKLLFGKRYQSLQIFNSLDIRQCPTTRTAKWIGQSKVLFQVNGKTNKTTLALGIRELAQSSILCKEILLT